MTTDPYTLLGLPRDADDEAVRAAYLAAVRDCPPERDRTRFEAIQAAYEQLRNHRSRLAHALFDTTPPTIGEVVAALGDIGGPPRPIDAARLRRLLTDG
ncbi:J domain-containing protein [Endothiovibrio diazotrophicus]